MRKLILHFHVTPDGFCSHDAAVPGGDFMRSMNSFMGQLGTVVFGRVTYELFRQFWPQVAKERTWPEEMVRYSDLIDGIEKLVFSKTLQEAGWKNTRVLPDVSKEAVEELKRGEGKDIVVFGGPGLISQLLKLDVFDEFYLSIVPVLSGGGYRLFADIKGDPLPLEFVDMETFVNGFVVLHYRRKRLNIV